MTDDRIGKYRADYSLLSADDLAREDPDLTELYMNSRPTKPKGGAKLNAAKTHCRFGHEFTPDNTYLKPTKTRGGVQRVCRACKAIRDEERRRTLGQKKKGPPQFIKMRRSDLKAIYNWLREPDWAEDFSLAQMIDWVNRRPIAPIAAAVAPSSHSNGER